MKLIILNYDSGVIDIISNVSLDIDFERLLDKLGYKSKNISWMTIEDDSVVNTFTYDPTTERILYDNENLLR